MTKAIVQILLSHRPTIPSLNRWTTIWPSLVFYLRSSAIHRIYEQLMRSVFGPMEVKMFEDAVKFEKADRAQRGGKVDDQLLSSFHWHAVNGKRLSIAKEFWEAPRTLLELALCGLILQPLFHLTFWLLKHAKDVPDDIHQPPAFLDWLNELQSPVMGVLQYFAGMLVATRRSSGLWQRWSGMAVWPSSSATRP